MPPRPRLFTLEGHRLGPPGVDQLPWDLTAFHEAAAGGTEFSNVMQDDQPLRVLSAPLRARGQTQGVVQIVYPLGEMQLLLDQLVHILLALIPFSLIAAGLGGLFLTDRVLQPIRKLRQVARDITARDLSHRIELTGNDEFTELTRTFNEMIGRLDLSFEQQRRFVADASHELRTPLSIVMGSASLALASLRSPEEYRQALEVANTAATRMNRIVEDLLLLARSDSGQIDLEPVSVAVADLFVYARDAMMGSPGPPIHLKLPDQSLVVQCDAEYLIRVFVNLLSNAVRHTPPDGQISMDAFVDGAEVVARVVDTGDGISAEHVSRLGERFYRADSSRNRRGGGTGLGLAICKSILHAHGGSLQIESVPGRGTTVFVRLPRPD
ncbi:MAG: ATP-binding protein [Armatimonadota bacterium]|nr:ATP-binding protein [Armatimonadota bacterium]